MSNKAELSSLSTTLDELTQRVTTLADAAAAVEDEATASELYETERALRAASRRLSKLAT